MRKPPLLLFLLALSADALAQDGTSAANVLYRCTDAKGNLTVQNMPCPQGMREQKQIVGELKTAPMAPSLSAPASTPAPADFRMPDATMPVNPPLQPDVDRNDDPTAIQANGNAPTGNANATNNAPRLPPPVLFQCSTYDDNTYISEDPMPPPRRVPLQTTGLNGDPRLGRGDAYELKRDSCVRMPDQKLCAAWRQRLGETEVAWRYGKLENVDRNKAEFQRVQHIVNETTCSR